MATKEHTLAPGWIPWLRRMVRDYARGRLSIGGAVQEHRRGHIPRPPIVALLLDDLEPGFDAEAAVLRREPTNEIQLVTIRGDVELDSDGDGGTFKLSFKPDDDAEAEETADIAWNATAAELQEALEGLASIDRGDVFVRLGKVKTDTATYTTGRWIVQFTGQYENTDIPLMTVDASLKGSPNAVALQGHYLDDTGSVETVTYPPPIGTPTPLVAGAVGIAVDIPTFGYSLTTIECRDFAEVAYD